MRGTRTDRPTQKTEVAQATSAPATESGSQVQRKALRGMSFEEGAGMLSPVQQKEEGASRNPEAFAQAVVTQVERKRGHLDPKEKMNLIKDAAAEKKANPGVEVVSYALQYIQSTMGQ